MKSKLLLTALAGATILVGGCAVYPAYDPYYDEGPVVQVAPPPPQYEYIGAPPVMGQIWIGGYWNWVGSRYHWVPGRWEAPRPGHTWAPYRWERDGDRWRRQGGRWEPEHRPHVVPLPHAPSPYPRIDPGTPPPVAPPPRFEHRDGPSGLPPPPRYERRETPPTAVPMPPIIRQAPPPPNQPPAFERDRRDDRRNGDRDRDDRRGRDRDGDGRPDPR